MVARDNFSWRHQSGIDGGIDGGRRASGLILIAQIGYLAFDLISAGQTVDSPHHSKNARNAAVC